MAYRRSLVRKYNMVPMHYMLRVAVVLLLAAGIQGTSPAQPDELARAEQLLKQGRPDAALARVESYLAGHPGDARGRFLKGVILAEQKKSEEAIRVFTDLTYDFPELPEPYNNLAVLHAARGEYEKARMALETAIRADPKYAVAHENLGDIYAKMAAQSYERAAQLDRRNRRAATKLKLITELFSTP